MRKNILLKIIIIDDQEDSIEKLTFLLTKYCPNTTIIGNAHNGKDGIALINASSPDLVFLDVEMDDMTGFEMLERLDKINFKLIFTTAFDKYAIKAIRVAALDYLLKPIGKDDITTAIGRIQESNSLVINKEQLTELSSIAKGKNKKIDVIALTTSDGLVFKNINDIIHCEAESNYTIVHLRNKEKLVVSKTLKEIDETLEESGFFRVHHSHLVNLSCIQRYVKSDGGYVTLINGKDVSVARNKKEEFLELFSKF